ncbi:unnamed protein product [Oppiella nova]|uniref:OCIA domain-containing protein n=1 Tax=Oppiella nova TaxID=334625 RepID=A0A7R9MEG9_9ACAR|nr:unnamed protein product [Oppiella nova]CAG2175719.1 unnamed protein product [Oppiella nova]
MAKRIAFTGHVFGLKSLAPFGGRKANHEINSCEMSYLRDKNDNNFVNEFDDNTTKTSQLSPNYPQNDTNLYNRYKENAANDRLKRSSEGIPAISAEDFRMLRECNRESFWMRCLPLSVGICSLMFYLAHKKSVKPKVVHILSGTFGGWFLGKLSYRRTCEDRLIHSPSQSPFVTAMRRRRGIVRDDTVLTTDGQPADQSSDLFWDQPSKDEFGYGAHEFADYKDNDLSGGKGQGETKTYTTYDDLRAHNRANSHKPKPFSA